MAADKLSNSPSIRWFVLSDLSLPALYQLVASDLHTRWHMTLGSKSRGAPRGNGGRDGRI